jgi:hypothetical protein
MPVKIRVEVPSKLPDFSKWDQLLKAAIIDSQQIVVNQARQNISRNTKTGTARRSITAEDLQISGTKIVAPIGAGGAGAPYARGLEEGTGLWGPKHARYPILPVKAKALAWPSANMGAPGGKFRRLSGNLRSGVLRALRTGRMPHGFAYVVRKSVSHPGHKPMPFLVPALDQSISKILDHIQKVIDTVLGG